MIDVFILPRTGKQIKSVNFEDIKLNKKTASMWIDISDGSRNEFAELGKIFNLHTLTLEDLYKRHVRIKLEVFREYTFLVLYGIKREKKLSFFELDLIIGKNFVITSHRGKIDSYEELKNQKEKLEKILKVGPDFLLHRLIDMIVDSFIPVFETIDKEIDTIEEKVVYEPSNELLQKILGLRTEFIDARRFIPSQREVIAAIVRGESEFITRPTAAYYRDLYDNMIRINEKLDISRETLRTVLDIHILSSGNKTNDIVKTLTIMTALMLPFAIVNNIYSMNINLPFQHVPNLFYIMFGFMMVGVILMITLFKKKKWL